MHTMIFTDGSSRGNPGPGGWGAIVASEDTVTELGGRESETTNNRMELSAVIFALQYIPEENEITIYTDSAYVLSGSTRWIFGWQKNNWKTSKKEDVLNQDLWEKIFSLVSHKAINWQLLKGHAGIPANERCDAIATSYADNNPVILYHGSKERYGVSLAVETSTQSKISSRSKAFSYVSLVNGEIKTHPTWDECKARVHKVPGARYKKSVSQADEESIIKEFRDS